MSIQTISHIYGPDPTILLTSAAMAAQEPLLSQHNVTHCLCVAGSHEAPDPPWLAQGNMHFHRIPLKDSVEEDLSLCFNEAFSFIDSAAGPNQAVLVYCQKGISRSPSVVIGYLMARRSYSFERAFDLVKRRRPVVDPNLGFCAQLSSQSRQVGPTDLDFSTSLESPGGMWLATNLAASGTDVHVENSQEKEFIQSLLQSIRLCDAPPMSNHASVVE